MVIVSEMESIGKFMRLDARTGKKNLAFLTMISPKFRLKSPNKAAALYKVKINNSD